jgi:DNA-binding NtrC family response regulator
MPQRILVVDDDEAIANAVAEYLRMLGYQVDCARELEEAQALLDNDAAYGLVISDLALTSLHGTEGLLMLSDLRARFPWIHVILMTGYSRPDVEHESATLGVDLFLRKPVCLAELCQSVAALVGEP